MHAPLSVRRATTGKLSSLSKPMAKRLPVESLDIIIWNQSDKDLGLPSHIRECCAAEYGDLPIEESNKLKASVSGASVKFGDVRTIKVQSKFTPAMSLLGLCVGLDAIAQKPCFDGLIIRLHADELPTDVQLWIQQRRESRRAKSAPKQITSMEPVTSV